MAMFTTRRRRSWQRKKTRQMPWYLILGLIVIGIPVSLELLARLLGAVTGFDRQFADQESAIVQAYQMQFISPSGQPYSALPQPTDQPGQLLAIRNPLLGYQLKPQQKNQFVTINDQGFREAEAVPLQKANNEVRIFILGGSLAFGQLSSNDQSTFAAQLEKLLNDQVAAQKANPGRFQPTILPYTAEEVEKVMTRPPRIPERTYRVVNAAVPGYASGNQLALLMEKVSNYSPDIVIVLDNYADLLLPSTQNASDIPGLDRALIGERESSSTRMMSAVGGWFDRFYLVQGFEKLLNRQTKSEATLTALNLMTDSDKSLDQQLATDQELDRRIARYRHHLLQMARWSSAAKKRLIIGIQPDITGRQAAKQTPEEATLVASLGDQYAQRMRSGHAKLVNATKDMTKASANTTVLDLYKLYDTFEGRAFYNPTSLTDEANTRLAQEFYAAITGKLAIEPKPFEAGLSN